MKNCERCALLLILLLPCLLQATEIKEFTLSDITAIGLKQNPLISAKRSEIEARKSAYQASQRLVNPQLEFHMGQAESHDKLIKRDTEGVSLSQRIENPFARHHRIRISEEDWKATEYQYSTLVLNVTFEIKELFHRILLLKEKGDLAQKNLDSIKKIHSLIKRRASLGEVRELESIKLYVETLKAQNELSRIKTRLKLAQENLNAYLGNFLPPDFSVTGDLDYAPLNADEQTLLERALNTHPRIKEKEAFLNQAENNLSYHRWQRFPDFTLTGFSHKELDGRNTGIGISMDIPLWDFKSKNIAEAENLYMRQSDELKSLKLTLSTEIKSKLRNLRLSEETLNTFHTGLLKQAEESLKISEVSYTQGEISLIDYLDSQRTYYSILNEYQDSLYDWNVNKAALEKDIGEELQ